MPVFHPHMPSLASVAAPLAAMEAVVGVDN
jgi:hypothetical protein